MQIDNDTFEISLKQFGGKEITPNAIPIDVLDSYFAMLKRYIMGNDKCKGVNVEITEGSLKTIVIASAAFISGLVADTNAISAGNITINNPRAKIALEMQKYAKKNNAYIELKNASMKTPFYISKATNILNKKDIWVNYEGYIYGKIRDMGGVAPNIHVVDDKGKETKISTTEETLGGIEKNILYSMKLIHFSAKKNLSNNEMRDYTLIEIKDLPKFDKKAFEKTLETTTKEWAGVDTTKYLNELRYGE